jgi:hypothetical protein
MGHMRRCSARNASRLAESAALHSSSGTTVLPTMCCSSIVIASASCCTRSCSVGATAPPRAVSSDGAQTHVTAHTL